MMSRVAMLCAVLVVSFSPAWAGSTQDDNKARVQQFYDEVVNKGGLAKLNDFIAEDFVEHEPFPGLGTDRESLRKFFMTMSEAFADLKFDVRFMLAEGDLVAAYVTMSGTQKKEFEGIPSKGKKFSATTVDIIRISDGKAVEHWGATDSMSMMEQLGAMPEPPGK